jgi:hypothetical protein
MRWSIAALVATLACGCAQAPSRGAAASANDLTGAWRAQIQFRDGAFAAVHDLEFMYVFNAGGTMTESSNYDAAPPVPPAYGIWRKVGPNRYEAKYEFYATRPPTAFDEIAKGGGWPPAGRGVLSETITLSDDGKAYTSTIRYEAFDRAGKPIEGGASASGRGVRLGF